MERKWDILSHGKTQNPHLSVWVWWTRRTSKRRQVLFRKIESYFTLFESLLAPKSNPLLAVEELNFAKQGSMTSGEFHSHIVKIAKYASSPTQGQKKGMQFFWAWTVNGPGTSHKFDEWGGKRTHSGISNEPTGNWRLQCSSQHLSQLDSTSSMNFAAFDRRQNKGKSNK